MRFFLVILLALCFADLFLVPFFLPPTFKAIVISFSYGAGSSQPTFIKLILKLFLIR